MRRRIAVVALLVAALAGLVPLAAQAKASPLGSVRYIHHGLSVQAPHHKAGHGKVKQKLYAAYHLATKHAQLASLSFKDGSTLHVNQNTDLTLRSVHATYVKSGEVDVIDHGAHHQVVTAAATASAIGTEYDVRVVRGTGRTVSVIVTVVSGIVMVTTSQGSQQITSGQQVTVTSDGTISRPTSVDAARVIAWTAPIPPPAAASPTATPTNTLTPTPTGAQTAAITAAPVGAFLAPLDPINYLDCNDPTVAEFSVTGRGLLPSTTYNLTLTGSAAGFTLNTPVGSMTADSSGNVSATTFMLPQVPAHSSWTLVATPVGGGSSLTTPLETEAQFCVFPSAEAADGSITIEWAGEGFKPGATVTAMTSGAANGMGTAVAGPDGSFPPTTFTIHCTSSGTVGFVITGAILDDPNFSYTYPTSQDSTCA